MLHQYSTYSNDNDDDDDGQDTVHGDLEDISINDDNDQYTDEGIKTPLFNHNIKIVERFYQKEQDSDDDDTQDTRSSSITIDVMPSAAYSASPSPSTIETSTLTYRKHVKTSEELRRIIESTRVNDDELKYKSKSQRKFYKKQNELIDQILTPLDQLAPNQQETQDNDFKVKVAINGSLLVNIVLFSMQITAAIITGSLTLLATSVDAFMDLLSGFILFMTERAKKKKNYFDYPTGKSRMEPVGIIIFASLMSTVSVNLIVEGCTSLIKQNDKHIDLDILPICFVVFAIACKVIMYFYCRVLTHSSSCMILATDHRNDVTVNSFGLVMAILGDHVVWWLDPTGALIVALIILRSWTSEAYEQIQLLVGKTASPEILQKLTYIAFTHSPEILKVDTCRAFYFGNNLFVEVDIVLPRDMPLHKTHDIGESLQEKLELLGEVERAFVHVDYDYKHKPEHKRI
ncbi:hypothetical protein CYY_007540 [Polysphondylium violaceum]|uniref:Cation efflux protein cytoplasmic domain-containing protein n=1 Tax=Polysphondylium violaceum TaxID=133409 RepID=A0A8J4PRR2_9MYCE|nr:hypothetical protein CYY_007540 [Polysphondylium violaceum]